MLPEDVLPLDDVSAAAWLVAPLSGFSGRVRDVVPAAYDAHARVPRSVDDDDDDLEYVRTLLPLRDVLTTHTSTPRDCFFTFWEGFPLPPAWRRAPRLPLPHRDHLLFAGGLADLEVVCEAFGRVGYDEPTLWWPRDRAWVAHWEVESDAVYVGGTHALVEALLDAGLEASAVTPDDQVTIEE